MKPGIKTVKYIIIGTFCAVCAIGNLSNYIKKPPDASEYIIFYNTEQENDIISNDTSNDTSEDTASGIEERSGKININTAGVEELINLPGIGEVRAEAIIAYREAYGGFVAAEEIMEVRGIGQSTYEKIKDLITIH